MVRTLFGMSVGLNSIRFGVVPIEIIFSLIQTSFGMYNSLLPLIRTFEYFKIIWNGSDIVWNVSRVE